MNIEKKLENGVLTLAVGGRLDTNTSPELEAEMTTEGVSEIVFDFAALEYISSAGLRETVALFRTVTANGGTFAIRRLLPEVADVFTLTGFDKKIDIRAD